MLFSQKLFILFFPQVTATVWGGYQPGGAGGGPGAAPITTMSMTPSSLCHSMPSASNTMTQVDSAQAGTGQVQRDKDTQQNAPLPSFAKYVNIVKSAMHYLTNRIFGQLFCW